MHHYFLKKSYLQCKIIILWFATSEKVPKKQMGSFTPCQPGYLYIFQTFFCEMTKRQQLKQQQQQNVATQIGQFWTPIMCDWTANFQQIILKHTGKKYFLNWHQEPEKSPDILNRQSLTKGAFYSESEIRFSNLPISQKNYSKKLS